MNGGDWNNPRGGLGTVMLYGAAPISDPQPLNPVVPVNPFVPGPQIPPPFDLTKVGAEDIGVIMTRIRARIKVIEDQLAAVTPLQEELDGLRRMLECWATPSPSPEAKGASDK